MNVTVAMMQIRGMRLATQRICIMAVPVVLVMAMPVLALL